MAGKKRDKQDYLMGKIFGRLKVINFDKWYIKPSNGNRSSKWLCLCECGNTKSIIGTSLTGNLTKSCGCLVVEKSREIGKKTGHPDGGFNDLWNTYKRGAKVRNYEFSLNKEEFKNLTSSNCYYCNKLPLQVRKSQSKYGLSKDYNYNGIDRLTNSIGYTTNNTVSCCWTCNRMKAIFSENDFLDHITNIYQNRIKNKINEGNIR